MKVTIITEAAGQVIALRSIQLCNRLLKFVTEVLSLFTKLPDFPFLGRPAAMKTSALSEDLRIHHIYSVFLLFWL